MGFWLHIFSSIDYFQADAYTKIPMWCHPYDIKGNREQKRREKQDDLKCSPRSDIESQDLFNNM